MRSLFAGRKPDKSAPIKTAICYKAAATLGFCAAAPPRSAAFCTALVVTSSEQTNERSNERTGAGDARANGATARERDTDDNRRV